MSPLSIWLKAFWHCARTINRVLFDLVEVLRLATKSRSALVAENLFLRKQLAMFQERNVRPHRAEDSARWLMACLSRLFDWRDALVVVKPDTLIRWHRRGFRLFWRWKSKPVGRPALPKNLQELIRKMAAENPTWGEEHIANELKLKLGIRVSPRTVRKYLAEPSRPDAGSESAMADLRAQSCPGHRGLRLFRGVHSPIPHPLCIRDHGTGQAPDPASQCDGASER